MGKECYNCDCWDSDYGCRMPSYDKWYACPIEAKKAENKKEIEEYIKWLYNNKRG